MTEKLPLRPVDPRIGEVIGGAVNQRGVAEKVAAAAAGRGVTDVFFLGCGGSWASSVPAHVTLSAHASGLISHNLNAAEFLAAPSPRLSERSLVVASSHSGNTPETVAAARLAKEAGAYVVSVATDADNALGELGDVTLTYGSERTITSAKHVLLGQLAQELLRLDGAALDFEAVRRGYEALPDVLARVTEEHEETAARIAREIGEADMTYVVGGGASYGLAFLMSVCYLTEMQWKKSAYVSTGDFFHGAFEMVVDDAPVILFRGEDASRAMADRVWAFLPRFTSRAYALDSAAFELPGVPAAARGEVSAPVLATLTTRLADHYESVTGHSLDERRYMHKMAY
ncbi:fructoselysine-6-P-deglycase FrlB-like protein [Thermocatellispora tengchongensis]|uniref:Fructoselysine-6-P-deglycase FrlB-like protein n=1 Tax=Thermocatellispora tengchongensis TaxID=1073253 RepID=A0A840P5X9_9ACTN|nr:SIS domain-containing protein [Thermocatellispora tengchongensis]MBB5134399.1 fructoselysine-6-P-deglycase FrlB-like protein [Thermocatellispora tengchongensis]